MLSSTSSFDRAIPALPWRRTTAFAAVLVLGFMAAWELHWRSRGYVPCHNNSEGLWCFQREKVGKDDLVIIGDSRTRFDLDLDTWANCGQCRRPLLLGINGSCARPVLSDLANDPDFSGTVICNVTEPLFFAPGGPPIQRSEDRIKYYQKRTVSQVISDRLAMVLEKQFVTLQKEDLSLTALLGEIQLPNRAGAFIIPRLPPQLGLVSADNRSVMIERLERDESFQAQIKKIWMDLMSLSKPLDTPLREKLLAGVKADVEKIRARGGQVIFLRLPSSGDYLDFEKTNFPRKEHWDRLLELTGSPGIHFEDHPELKGFNLPEWSHLTGADAKIYTERLLQIMKRMQISLPHNS